MKQIKQPVCCCAYGTFAMGGCPAQSPNSDCRACLPARELFGETERITIDNSIKSDGANPITRKIQGTMRSDTGVSEKRASFPVRAIWNRHKAKTPCCLCFHCRNFSCNLELHNQGDKR